MVEEEEEIANGPPRKTRGCSDRSCISMPLVLGVWNEYI